MTTTVRYEPPEKPQLTLSLGLGLQQAALTCAGIIITPVIIIRAANGAESYLTWAVFGALLVSGLTTILQAVRVGPVGVGYPVVMGTSGAFIAVCVTALVDGGPAMLATLVVVSLHWVSFSWRRACSGCATSLRPRWRARSSC